MEIANCRGEDRLALWPCVLCAAKSLQGPISIYANASKIVVAGCLAIFMAVLVVVFVRSPSLSLRAITRVAWAIAIVSGTFLLPD